MADDDVLRYVPQRAMDQVYVQRRLATTPFGSALKAEPSDSAQGSGLSGSAVVSALASDQTHEKMSYRMNYPVCVVRGGPVYPNDTLRCVPPARSSVNPNSVDPRSVPQQIRPGVLTGPKPNPHWQKPPPPDPEADARLMKALGLPSQKNPLPRDALHPLLSSLQADANRVARELHPESGMLSNARRDDAPSSAHMHIATQVGAAATSSSSSSGNNNNGNAPTNTTFLPVSMLGGGGGGGGGRPGTGGTSGTNSSMGYGNNDDDDDEDSYYGSSSGEKKSLGQHQKRRPHDQRDGHGRGFLAEGALNPAPEYSDGVESFAASMPNSLTSIAAKALARALHEKPVTSVSALAKKQPEAANPEDVQKYKKVVKKGQLNLPPSPAFRNLTSVSRSILGSRSRDTRHLLERAICEMIPVSAPTPNELTQQMYDAVVGPEEQEEQEEDENIDEMEKNNQGDNSQQDQEGENHNNNEEQLSSSSRKQQKQKRQKEEEVLTMSSPAAKLALTLNQSPTSFAPPTTNPVTAALSNHPTANALLASASTFSGIPSSSTYVGSQAGVSTLRADEVEIGEMLRAPIDLSPLWCAGTPLHAWDIASASLRGAPLTNASTTTKKNNDATLTTAEQVTRNLKQITTQSASLFSSATARPKLVQYLTDVGIRTGDALYQILAPSQSEFTRQPERALNLKQFGNTNETPGNTYGFDNGRFSVLLEHRGFDIEEASLNGATFLDPSTIRLFGQCSPFLRLFDVSGCVHLQGSDIATALTRSRQSLRLLNISMVDSITGKDLDAILPSLNNLIALSMSGLNKLNAKIDDFAFNHLYAMKSLRILDVSFCQNIGDAGLVAAAQGCPCLEFIDMRGCHQVTDAAAAAIASYCSQLRCWRLSYCNKLTSASLSLITRSACKKLEVLAVDGMSSKALTEPVFVQAIERGSNLASLSLAGTSNAHLTDESLAQIVKSCPALQNLDISGGQKFSIDALTSLIYDLKKLRRLVLSASGLSKDQTALLRKVKQTVEIVDFEPVKVAPVRKFGVKAPPPPPPAKQKPGQKRR